MADDGLRKGLASYGDAGRGSPYRGYYDTEPGLLNLRGSF